MALSPNLAITATGGFPYANLRAPTHLFVPEPNPETLSATATLIARMAVSAGHRIDFHLETKLPQRRDGAALLVGAAADFTPAALRAAGLDAQKMQSIWKTGIISAPSGLSAQAMSRFARENAERVALERNFPARCQMQMRAPIVAQKSPTSLETDVPPAKPFAFDVDAEPKGPLSDILPPRLDLAAEWQAKIYGGPSWFPKVSLPTLDTAIFGRIEKWGLTQYQAGRTQIFAGLAKRDEASVIQDSASLLLAQASQGNSGNGIWTIVTAPTPQALRESVACLVDPRVWNQVRGAISALDTAKAQITSNMPDNPHFISTQGFSIFNMRLIAAGWFSQNLWAFIGVVLSTGLFLGLMTRIFVRNVGRRL